MVGIEPNAICSALQIKWVFSPMDRSPVGRIMNFLDPEKGYSLNQANMILLDFIC